MRDVLVLNRHDTNKLWTLIKRNSASFTQTTLVRHLFVQVWKKIYLKILSSRLTNWATRNNVINEAGFRRGYSTVDNIFSLQAIIVKYASKQKGRVLYIDFFKTFDSCVHKEIWQSIKRKGIRTNNKLLFVFESLYLQLMSCMKIRYVRSSHLTDKTRMCKLYDHL